MALRMALRSARPMAMRQALSAMAPAVATRSMALGPAKGGEISDELLAKLGTLSTQGLIDGLWVMGWPTAFIEGARPLGKGMKCVGGDIKFLRLMQRQVAGLVTDGSVRDTDELLGYGFPVFSHSTTAKQGPAVMQPWACNDVITCGGVA